MNFIRTFFDSGSNEELMAIPSGEFLLLRSPNSPKSTIEYIFNDAAISIKRVSEFEYYLHVERQDAESEDISDGDSDDIAPDEMSLLSATSKKDDTWSYKIDEDLKIKKSWDADKNVTIIWNNTKGDVGERVEFVIEDSIPYSDINKFFKVIQHCLYESKFKKASDQATKEELSTLIDSDTIDDNAFISEDEELNSMMPDDMAPNLRGLDDLTLNRDSDIAYNKYYGDALDLQDDVGYDDVDESDDDFFEDAKDFLPGMKQTQSRC